MNTIESKFDRKTFIASSLFFFAAVVNARDFPVSNVPLIYPAFIIFVMIIGTYYVSEGFRRTRFLILLVITYWSYVTFIRFLNGRPVALGDLPYLSEPLLIFCAAGMATIRPGGTKAAIWALVFIIVLSTVAGIWIYFIGEPFASLHSAFHASVGGNLVEGETIRTIDIAVDSSNVKKINSGLSAKVFGFSYQLAAAILITIVSLLSIKRTIDTKYLLLSGALIILLAGMITNTERATILSVLTGLLTYFWMKGMKLISFRMIGAFVLCLVITLVIFNHASGWEEHKTLHNRSLVSEKTYDRVFFMPKTAVESIFHEPFGIGRTTAYYIDVAYKVGWAKADGNFLAPHNHFANVIMYTGLIGIFLIMLLFWNLWKKIRKTRYFQLSAYYSEEAILAAASVTMIIHSLTHNAGFFKLEPATHIVFGLLWGGAAKDKYITYNNLLKKWIIE